MNVITILEGKLFQDARKFYFIHLEVEAAIIRANYDWLKVVVKEKVLHGKGVIDVNGVQYHIELKYSPFYRGRMDRIFITNHKIKYHDDIHLYNSNPPTLCLYHPIIDKPLFKLVPLHKMIPWITEWCHFYGEWKKYGVWLAPEIKHLVL